MTDVAMVADAAADMAINEADSASNTDECDSCGCGADDDAEATADAVPGEAVADDKSGDVAKPVEAPDESKAAEAPKANEPKPWKPLIKMLELPKEYKADVTAAIAATNSEVNGFDDVVDGASSITMQLRSKRASPPTIYTVNRAAMCRHSGLVRSIVEMDNDTKELELDIPDDILCGMVEYVNHHGALLFEYKAPMPLVSADITPYVSEKELEIMDALWNRDQWHEYIRYNIANDIDYMDMHGYNVLYNIYISSKLLHKDPMVDYKNMFNYDFDFDAWIRMYVAPEDLKA
jgi:hypothetical protein